MRTRALDIPHELFQEEMDPERGCWYCHPTLFGWVPSPIPDSQAEQRHVAILRMAGLHVHTGLSIGDHQADAVVPLTPVPLIVEYDGGWVHSLDRTVANEAAQRGAWERRGFTVVRLRDVGLPPTSPLDLCLPRGLRSMTDRPLIDLIVGHVLRRAGLA